ncbi:unnamed protein product [Schistosoma turkestanicum]|nr:unnamed protein product [Schistosoma turkestanicum]
MSRVCELENTKTELIVRLRELEGVMMCEDRLNNVMPVGARVFDQSTKGTEEVYALSTKNEKLVAEVDLLRSNISERKKLLENVCMEVDEVKGSLGFLLMQVKDLRAAHAEANADRSVMANKVSDYERASRHLRETVGRSTSPVQDTDYAHEGLLTDGCTSDGLREDLQRALDARSFELETVTEKLKKCESLNNAVICECESLKRCLESYATMTSDLENDVTKAKALLVFVVDHVRGLRSDYGDWCREHERRVQECLDAVATGLLHAAVEHVDRECETMTWPEHLESSVMLDRFVRPRECGEATSMQRGQDSDSVGEVSRLCDMNRELSEELSKYRNLCDKQASEIVSMQTALREAVEQASCARDELVAYRREKVCVMSELESRLSALRYGCSVVRDQLCRTEALIEGRCNTVVAIASRDWELGGNEIASERDTAVKELSELRAELDVADYVDARLVRAVSRSDVGTEMLDCTIELDVALSSGFTSHSRKTVEVSVGENSEGDELSCTVVGGWSDCCLECTHDEHQSGVLADRPTEFVDSGTQVTDRVCYSATDTLATSEPTDPSTVDQSTCIPAEMVRAQLVSSSLREDASNLVCQLQGELASCYEQIVRLSRSVEESDASLMDVRRLLAVKEVEVVDLREERRNLRDEVSEWREIVEAERRDFEILRANMSVLESERAVSAMCMESRAPDTAVEEGCAQTEMEDNASDLVSTLQLEVARLREERAVALTALERSQRELMMQRAEFQELESRMVMNKTTCSIPCETVTKVADVVVHELAEVDNTDRVEADVLTGVADREVAETSADDSVPDIVPERLIIQSTDLCVEGVSDENAVSLTHVTESWTKATSEQDEDNAELSVSSTGTLGSRFAEILSRLFDVKSFRVSPGIWPVIDACLRVFLSNGDNLYETCPFPFYLSTLSDLIFNACRVSFLNDELSDLRRKFCNLLMSFAFAADLSELCFKFLSIFNNLLFNIFISSETSFTYSLSMEIIGLLDDFLTFSKSSTFLKIFGDQSNILTGFSNLHETMIIHRLPSCILCKSIIYSFSHSILCSLCMACYSSTIKNSNVNNEMLNVHSPHIVSLPNDIDKNLNSNCSLICNLTSGRMDSIVKSQKSPIEESLSIELEHKSTKNRACPLIYNVQLNTLNEQKLFNDQYSSSTDQMNLKQPLSTTDELVLFNNVTLNDKLTTFNKVDSSSISNRLHNHLHMFLNRSTTTTTTTDNDYEHLMQDDNQIETNLQTPLENLSLIKQNQLNTTKKISELMQGLHTLKSLLNNNSIPNEVKQSCDSRSFHEQHDDLLKPALRNDQEFIIKSHWNQVENNLHHIDELPTSSLSSKTSTSVVNHHEDNRDNLFIKDDNVVEYKLCELDNSMRKTINYLFKRIDEINVKMKIIENHINDSKLTERLMYTKDKECLSDREKQSDLVEQLNLLQKRNHEWETNVNSMFNSLYMILFKIDDSHDQTTPMFDTTTTTTTTSSSPYSPKISDPCEIMPNFNSFINDFHDRMMRVGIVENQLNSLNVRLNELTEERDKLNLEIIQLKALIIDSRQVSQRENTTDDDDDDVAVTDNDTMIMPTEIIGVNHAVSGDVDDADADDNTANQIDYERVEQSLTENCPLSSVSGSGSADIEEIMRKIEMYTNQLNCIQMKLNEAEQEKTKLLNQMKQNELQQMTLLVEDNVNNLDYAEEEAVEAKKKEEEGDEEHEKVDKEEDIHTSGRMSSYHEDTDWYEQHLYTLIQNALNRLNEVNQYFLQSKQSPQLSDSRQDELVDCLTKLLTIINPINSHNNHSTILQQQTDKNHIQIIPSPLVEKHTGNTANLTNTTTAATTTTTRVTELIQTLSTSTVTNTTSSASTAATTNTACNRKLATSFIDLKHVEKVPISSSDSVNPVEYLWNSHELYKLAKYLLNQYHIVLSELELQSNTDWCLRQRLSNANNQLSRLTNLLSKSSRQGLSSIEKGLSLGIDKNSLYSAEHNDGIRQKSLETIYPPSNNLHEKPTTTTTATTTTTNNRRVNFILPPDDEHSSVKLDDCTTTVQTMRNKPILKCKSNPEIASSSSSSLTSRISDPYFFITNEMFIPMKAMRSTSTQTMTEKKLSCLSRKTFGCGPILKRLSCHCHSRKRY